MKRKVPVFLTGAGMLAACSAAAKLLGAMYRIPLTGVLGGEGMGLYQMVFPLYTLLLTASSGGLPVAIARLVAVRLADGDEAGTSKVLKVAVASLSALGAAGTLVLAACGKAIARAQGNPDAGLAYLAIAPSVFFVAVLGCYRGYYQGRANMLPSAASQLVEQTVKLTAGLAFARLLSPRGVKFAAAGALAGVTLGELVATLALAIMYAVRSTRRKNRSAPADNMVKLPHDLGGRAVENRGPLAVAGKKSRAEAETAADAAALAPARKNTTLTSGTCVKNSETREILRGLMRTALPVTFASLALPLTQLTDSVLIINILTRLGMTAERATMEYGLLGGVVMTLVNMPSAVILAFSTAIVPKVAGARTPESGARGAQRGLSTCFMLGLISSLLLFSYPMSIIGLLYSRGLGPIQTELAARLLRLAAPTVLYVSVVQASTAALQGMGEAKMPALVLLGCAGVKAAVTAATLFVFGTAGAVIGSIACYASAAILDLILLRRKLPVGSGAGGAAVWLVASAAFLLVSGATKRIFAFLPPFALLVSSALPSAAAFFLAAGAASAVRRRARKRKDGGILRENERKEG